MSVSYLERALTVKRLRNDDKGCAATLLRLGEERLALGQSRAALENLTLALSAFEALGDNDHAKADRDKALELEPGID